MLKINFWHIILTNQWLELIIRLFKQREVMVGGNDVKYLFIYSIDEGILPV